MVEKGKLAQNIVERRNLLVLEINPFPHTTNQQQTTLQICGQKYGKSL